MTGAEIGELVGGAVLLMTAAATWLKAKAAATSAAAAHARINAMQNQQAPK